MGIFKKLQRLESNGNSEAQNLYQILMTPTYSGKNYQRRDMDENMEVVNFLFIDYWKPRYLLNHNTKCAYEFMNANAHLVGVEDTDIDWNSLKKLPDEYLQRIESRNALFPSFIRCFENGVAEVQWQINPDGRYWMDEDGYGMTPDDEFNIYGFIDTECNVVVPYQTISDYKQLKVMRAEAEKIVASR